MEQSREKLKVIDIEFKRNNTNKQTLFFDVIEHKFEDQFLVITHYKEYADKTVRGLQTYIPKENIVQFVVYEEKADYEKYLDDLIRCDTHIKNTSKDIMDCHIVWYNKGSGGISDRIIRYVDSVSFEKRVDGYVVINYREKPDDKALKLFRVPHGDVIQLTKLINGEEAGNWYE